MPIQTQPGHYADFTLTPSQCADWIISQASGLSQHTVVAFGWMNQPRASAVAYHRDKMAEQIERIRELCDRLEAHLEHVEALTVEVEAPALIEEVA
jgi:hypothetical protein